MARERMSEAKLWRLAAKYKAAKEAEAKAKEDAKAAAAQIIPELTARKIKAVEGEGLRVNKVVGEETVNDIDAMEEHLSPKMFRKLTKRVADPEAIKAAIDDGTLKPNTLAKFQTVRDKAPYILVTYKDS